MKDIINSIYNGLFRFIPLKKYFKFKSNLSEYFPEVGFLNYERKLELEHSLGITIKNIEFFEQALIHRSYLQILSDTHSLSNERLEFLGDAILGFVVAEYLFQNYPDKSEGELTKLRALLVNKNSLIKYSKNLELDKFIMLSFSAAKSLQNGSESILADAFEAIVAAIYLDSGIDITKKFIYKNVIPLLSNDILMVDKNYKSNLLELLQANGLESPRYNVLDEKGPQHDKEFIVGVYIQDILAGVGNGKSKKQAEQLAAKKALDNPLLNEIFEKSVNK